MGRSRKKSWLKKLDPQARDMIMVLLESDFEILDQEPYQEVVEFEGQKIQLPFTNSFLRVLLHKVEGKWHFVTRWYSDETMPERLEIAYYMYSNLSELALDYEMGRQGILMLPMKKGAEHPDFPVNGSQEPPKTLFKHEPPATAVCMMALKMEISRLGGSLKMYTPLVRCYLI